MSLVIGVIVFGAVDRQLEGKARREGKPRERTARWVSHATMAVLVVVVLAVCDNAASNWPLWKQGLFFACVLALAGLVRLCAAIVRPRHQQ